MRYGKWLLSFFAENLRESAPPLKRADQTALSHRFFLADYPSAGEIVGMEFEGNFVAGNETNEVKTEFAGSLGNAPMAIGQFHPIRAMLEHLGDRTLDLEAVAGRRAHFYLFRAAFSGRQVRISGSSSVMRTVCSK